MICAPGYSPLTRCSIAALAQQTTVSSSAADCNQQPAACTGTAASSTEEAACSHDVKVRRSAQPPPQEVLEKEVTYVVVLELDWVRLLACAAKEIKSGR